MNTTRTGMRTVLAAAAAGALVMGSAAGAMAAKPMKAEKPAVKVQSVSIKGHSPLNVFDISTTDGTATTTLRPIKVRSTLRYAKAVPTDPTVYPVVGMTLAAYTKKADGKFVGIPAIPVLPALTAKVVGKKDLRYTSTFTITPDQAMPLATALATQKVYLCISELTVPASITSYSTQAKKRLNIDLKSKQKPVRDCVRVVSVDPTK